MGSSPKRYRKGFVCGDLGDLVVAIRTGLCVGLGIGLTTGFLLPGVIVSDSPDYNPKFGSASTPATTVTSTPLQETVSENSGSDKVAVEEGSPPDIAFAQPDKSSQAGRPGQDHSGQSRSAPDRHETRPDDTPKSDNAAMPSNKPVASPSSADPDQALAVARLFSQVAITLVEDAILNGNPLPLMAHLARPDVRRTLITMADSEDFDDFVLSMVQNPRVAAILTKISYSKPLQRRLVALVDAPQVQFIVDSLADKPQVREAIKRALELQRLELPSPFIPFLRLRLTGLQPQ
ncbi:MAG TPA: hypothetical protein GX507_07190 [Clostridia bacterium]|nr:hypothetical protein [Clostridia bacterium]